MRLDGGMLIPMMELSHMATSSRIAEIRSSSLFFRQAVRTLTMRESLGGLPLPSIVKDMWLLCGFGYDNKRNINTQCLDYPSTAWSNVCNVSCIISR